MSLDPRRVQAVFSAALEAPDAAARAAVLDRECAGDAELRREVEALLRAHADPASVLERPPATAASPTEASTQQPGGAAADEDGTPLPPPISLTFLQPSTKPGSLGRIGHYEVLE